MTDPEAEIARGKETKMKGEKKRWAANMASFASKKFDRIRSGISYLKKQRQEMSVSKLLSLVSTLGKLSWRAYDDPKADGIREDTTTGNRITHVNYGFLNDSVEGVLKIFLNRAEDVADADLIGYSDPCVIFSAGFSHVKSKTIDDERNPVWNSTHYLLVRKPGVVQRENEQLHIRLYDMDTWCAQMLDRSTKPLNVRGNFLGEASVDLAELKKPGLRKHTIYLQKVSKEGDIHETGTTVFFETEFLSFEDACKERNKSEGAAAWNEKMETDRVEGWPRYRANVNCCNNFHPVSFINCKDSETQVWVHANAKKKVVSIAFRGTEVNKLKDLITDFSIFRRKVEWPKNCMLTMNPKLKKGIRVHSGFKAAYESVWESLMTVVNSITNWSADWTIYVTGHSLGGAIATLCAFEYANRKNAAGEGPTVVMVNFGAPRVGNNEFSRAYSRTVPISYRVVNGLDIIHKLPFFLKHVKHETMFLQDGAMVIDKHSRFWLEPEETETPEKLDRHGVLDVLTFKGHFQDYYRGLVKKAIDLLNNLSRENTREYRDGFDTFPQSDIEEESSQRAESSTEAN